jgi:hypothetical protein
MNVKLFLWSHIPLEIHFILAQLWEVRLKLAVPWNCPSELLRLQSQCGPHSVRFAYGCDHSANCVISHFVLATYKTFKVTFLNYRIQRLWQQHFLKWRKNCSMISLASRKVPYWPLHLLYWSRLTWSLQSTLYNKDNLYFLFPHPATRTMILEFT